MKSIITNAHVTVNGNGIFEQMQYTVSNIIVFTDTPGNIEASRATVISAVKSVFEGRTVEVVFEFEK